MLIDIMLTTCFAHVFSSILRRTLISSYVYAVLSPPLHQRACRDAPVNEAQDHLHKVHKSLLLVSPWRVGLFICPGSAMLGSTGYEEGWITILNNFGFLTCYFRISVKFILFCHFFAAKCSALGKDT